MTQCSLLNIKSAEDYFNLYNRNLYIHVLTYIALI